MNLRPIPVLFGVQPILITASLYRDLRRLIDVIIFSGIIPEVISVLIWVYSQPLSSIAFTTRAMATI